MTWSYTGDPTSSNRDQVRFLIQDTDSEDQLLQDGEVDFLLLEHPAPQRAAVRACEILMIKFAREVDSSVGSVREACSQRHKQYTELLKTLKRRASIANVAPLAGGIDQLDKDVQERDTNRVRPFFERDTHDFGSQEDKNTIRVINITEE